MRNEEFEVVRDLMSGRAPGLRRYASSGHTVAPASFREIDGEILASQYVAHRKFLETEAMARQFGAPGDVVLNARRRGGGQHPRGGTAGSGEHARGWLGWLARLFGWR